MRTHALRALLLIVPLALGTASAASAGVFYSPELFSTSAGFCVNDNLVLTVQNAAPNLMVRFRIDFGQDGGFDIDQQVLANAVGFASLTVPFPVGVNVFAAETSGFIQPDLSDPDIFPVLREIAGDRLTCPGLPPTGSDSFPIGKTALFVSLAGALLAVVAIRRRSRDHDPVTTAV